MNRKVRSLCWEPTTRTFAYHGSDSGTVSIGYPKALRTHTLRLLGPKTILYVGLLGYFEPVGFGWVPN